MNKLNALLQAIFGCSYDENKKRGEIKVQHLLGLFSQELAFKAQLQEKAQVLRSASRRGITSQ